MGGRGSGVPRALWVDRGSPVSLGRAHSSPVSVVGRGLLDRGSPVV